MNKNYNKINILFNTIKINKKFKKEIINKILNLTNKTKINDNGIKIISNIFIIIYLHKPQYINLFKKILDDMLLLDKLLLKELILFINSINYQNISKINSKLIDETLLIILNLFIKIDTSILAFSILNELILILSKIKKINNNYKIIFFINLCKEFLLQYETKKYNYTNIYIKHVSKFNKYIVTLNNWFDKN